MFSWRRVFVPLGLIVMFGSFAWGAEIKVWHVIATKDQTFIVEGEKKPVITVKPGETVHLRITAEKAQRAANDASVHTVTITQMASEGWNLSLKTRT